MQAVKQTGTDFDGFTRSVVGGPTNTPHKTTKKGSQAARRPRNWIVLLCVRNRVWNIQTLLVSTLPARNGPQQISTAKCLFEFSKNQEKRLGDLKQMKESVRTMSTKHSRYAQLNIPQSRHSSKWAKADAASFDRREGNCTERTNE
jgi:hypothetical protein